MNTVYQQAKSMLRSHAEYVKVQFSGDKPAIRQSINDYTDSICKDFKLSEYKRNLLSNYACKLHP
jgi:hypothetical protein